MGERISFDGPDGREVHEWNGRLTNQEAITVQTTTGLLPQAFFEGLAALDPTAWTAMVRLLWARDGRAVKFSDVEFDLMSCMLEDDDEPDAAAAEAPGGDESGN